MTARRMAWALAGLGLSACTWVPLSTGGETVRLQAADQVSGCERLGHTTSRVADHVWIFSRNERAVREELTSLARNEAALMQGDTVVPESAPENGRQSFGIYRCGGA